MNNAKNWRKSSRHLCWLSTANAHLRYRNVVSKVAKGTFQHFKLLPGTNGSSGNLASRNMRMAVAPLIPPNQWMIVWQMRCVLFTNCTINIHATLHKKFPTNPTYKVFSYHTPLASFSSVT